MLPGSSVIALKERAASLEIAEKRHRTWKAYQDEVIEAHKTDDLSDSQPTKGNIEGGLTAIEVDTGCLPGRAGGRHCHHARH